MRGYESGQFLNAEGEERALVSIVAGDDGHLGDLTGKSPRFGICKLGDAVVHGEEIPG